MPDRFLEFTIAISKLNKLIQKVKADGMSMFQLKGVHTICLYQLIGEKDGMTFSQIASACDLDSALISRSLNELVSNELIEKLGKPGKYNARYCLTAEGERVALEIKEIIESVQTAVDVGITDAELDVFYKVLFTLIQNFEELSEKGDLTK